MDILVVDDEKAIRDSVVFALEAEGHYCEAVDGLNIALLRLKEEPFDMAFVFLDEIGELPMDIQPKLLRLLQERAYERVGDPKTHQAEVRVIAATNRDLRSDIAESNFREDLFYRLNVISVVMPPLRERPNDLVSFAENFVQFFARRSGRDGLQLSKDALARLMSYSWPGNLRELRNAIERAVILAAGGEIEAHDLPSPSEQGASPLTRSLAALVVEGSSEEKAAPEPGMGEPGRDASLVPVVVGADVSLQQLEEAHLRRIVARATSMAEAAQTLGIDQATLYRKRKKLGLN